MTESQMFLAYYLVGIIFHIGVAFGNNTVRVDIPSQLYMNTVSDLLYCLILSFLWPIGVLVSIGFMARGPKNDYN